MRIGYRTLSLGEASFHEKLQLAVNLQLDAVEVAANEFADQADAQAARALADDMGLDISIVAHDLEFCSPQRLDDSLEDLQRTLHVCQALGARSILSRSMNPPSGVPQTDTWHVCVEAFRAATEMCDEGRIRFAVEADPDCFVNNLERVERLIDGVCHPNFYINFDPANYYLAGSDPLKVIDRLGARMIHGHIGDGIYQQQHKGQTPIGDGEVPYAEIFAKLQDCNVDICMAIDHCQGADEVAAAADHIKSVLRVLGM